MRNENPFRYFDSSPKIVHLVVIYARLRLSLRNVEDLLAEQDIDICMNCSPLLESVG